MANTPVQVRMPQWAKDYVEERAARKNSTKTAVVLEALDCLRSQEVAELMRDGYEEMAATHTRLAEDDLPATAGTLPDW
jgi:hypothetical protein